MKTLPAVCTALLCAVLTLNVRPALAQTGDGAAPATPPQTGTDAPLTAQIETLLDAPALQSGFQGVCIQSLKDNTVWYERNSGRVFLPASNNKLLTSAAALALLGKNYIFATRLYRTGPVRNGVCYGDLILRGAGDPLLSPTQLNALALAVHRAGIRRVTGHIRYDDSFFDRQRLGDAWTWDDEPAYYSAQISALNCNENLVSVQVTPGRKPGDVCRVAIGPTSRYILIQNQSHTTPSKSKNTLAITRLRGQNTLLITGNLPIDVKPQDNQPTGITVEDPSRFTATLFMEDCRKAGIRLSHPEPADGPPAPPNAPLVAEHRSPPLSVLLRLLNKPSDNLMAECFLKTVGAAKTGKGTGGQDGTGAQTARAFFKSIGLDMGQLQQADGSGLSRMDYVSPRTLVRLLAYLHTRPDFSVLYDALPIAGVDGTLRRRLKNTPAQGNCHAKTGSLSHVSACSGYVTTADGELLAFSLLMNNHLAPASEATSTQDKIIALLAAYHRPTPTP